MPHRTLNINNLKVHGVTTNGYANYGCRCPLCTRAWADYCQKRKKERAQNPLEIPEYVHGTYNGYSNWSCRCSECRQAHLVYERTHKGYGPREPWRHGTSTGYRRHNCRCTPCVEAQRADKKRVRENRKTKAKPESIHGTRYGYTEWHCRCSRCKEANSLYEKNRRVKNEVHKS